MKKILAIIFFIGCIISGGTACNNDQTTTIDKDSTQGELFNKDSSTNLLPDTNYDAANHDTVP